MVDPRSATSAARRWAAILAISILAGALSGCRTTHPRGLADLGERVQRIRRVLILDPLDSKDPEKPQFKFEWKYIYTDHYMYSAVASRNIVDQLIGHVKSELEKKGFEVVTQEEFASKARDPRARQKLQSLGKRFRDAREFVIVTDPGYERGMEETSLGDPLRGIARDLPGIDGVIGISGAGKVETDKEFWVRWGKNLGYNVALIPFSLLSALIPITMPLTVTLSFSFFEGNPDKLWLELGLLDARTGEIIYQNDRTTGQNLSKEDAVQDAAFVLLEKLPERKPEP